MCLEPLYEGFAKWYCELGKLRIFWARPVTSIRHIVLGHVCAYEVTWVAWGRPRWRSLLLFPSSPDYGELPVGSGEYDYVFVVAREEWPPPQGARAESLLYFWDLSRIELPEPNLEVEVEVFEDWGESEEALFKSVMRRSWGFYRPPRPEDHLVLLARLGSEPVAMTYLNKHNFNLDYGVHVVREFWRRRIGTRIVKEAFSLARSMGAEFASVVRVLRKVGGTAADVRTIQFYRACKPGFRYRVYWLRSDT